MTRQRGTVRSSSSRLAPRTPRCQAPSRRCRSKSGSCGGWWYGGWSGYIYISCSHVHWKTRATHLLLSCVRAGVLGSGVGKDAKTKQPTITTACQWSQQRLSMQSHKEGSKSQLVPVCLYSLTASQNSSAKTVQNSRYNPFGSALDVKMEKIDDLRMISIKHFQVYSIKVYGFCILLYNVWIIDYNCKISSQFHASLRHLFWAFGTRRFRILTRGFNWICWALVSLITDQTDQGHQ